mmetsp:Transcript_25391/g.65405  ORF Transcript_25391/g.65405 Transcript_25391/m.65405 type:complete len:135 (+) Transcript_25391:343-747(+)
MSFFHSNINSALKIAYKTSNQRPLSETVGLNLLHTSSQQDLLCTHMLVCAGKMQRIVAVPGFPRNICIGLRNKHLHNVCMPLKSRVVQGRVAAVVRFIYSMRGSIEAKPDDLQVACLAGQPQGCTINGYACAPE